MMKKFFYYCFYRIHSWYIMHKIDRTPRIYSTHWIASGQSFNVMSLLTIFFYYFDIKFEFLFVLAPIYITLYVLNYSFLLTEKKYQELTEKYKNEKHKKLKGWGVFFYLVSSFVVWMICTAIFKDSILDNYHINLNFIKRFLES
ncbi:MAG: hypothetical protein IKG83_01855 [Prevotella sp.]|nr:hypothetical protein [Prevotella sp.]